MAVSYIASASAAQGATFTMPGAAQAGDFVVLNYGSAANTSGVSFLTPSGFTLYESNDSLRRCLFMFGGFYTGAAPSITCSAGNEYNCTLSVFRGVHASFPVGGSSNPNLDNGTSIDLLSPGRAYIGGIAVGCIFIEDDNGLSGVTGGGTLAVHSEEVSGENSTSAIVYWPSPDGYTGWRVGAVGFDRNTQVPAITVNQDGLDDCVTSTLILRPA